MKNKKQPKPLHYAGHAMSYNSGKNEDGSKYVSIGVRGHTVDYVEGMPNEDNSYFVIKLPKSSPAWVKLSGEVSSEIYADSIELHFKDPAVIDMIHGLANRMRALDALKLGDAK